jgi:hypothetical protein
MDDMTCLTALSCWVGIKIRTPSRKRRSSLGRKKVINEIEKAAIKIFPRSVARELNMLVKRIQYSGSN